MKDLKISWHIEGESFPVKALFVWKREGKTVQSTSLSLDELDKEIQKLEDKGMKPPREFLDAFVELKRRS